LLGITMVRILCVDDEEDEFHLLERNLKRSDQNIQVKWASTGSEALEALEKEEYDCILCDFIMPGMDGLELLNTLRGKRNDTPFVFLTGRGSEEVAAKSMRMGADDYFTKEIGKAHFNILANRIKSIIELHTQRKKVPDEKKSSSEETMKQLHLISELREHKSELERQNEELRIFQQELEAARDKYSDLFDFAPIGYFMIGANGLVREVNLTGASLLGLERNQVEGKLFSNYISRSDQETFEQHRRQVLETKQRQACEIQIVRADGSRFPAQVESNVVQRGQLKESYTRLEAQTRLLADTSRELETFAYTVSHDLKAPLRRISSWVEILIDNYGGILNENGMQYLKKLDENSREMCRLVDVLLNFSRLLRTEIKREEVDLSTIARSVAAEFTSDHPERQTEFIIADGIKANADRNLVQVMLENLISNAWKYTSRKEKARIEFGETSRNSQHIFYVRDNGVGFDPNYADKLFVAFQRLHDDDEFDGLGIGLATVQRIALRHGGRVWAEGKVGEGATFYFTLG